MNKEKCIEVLVDDSNPSVRYSIEIKNNKDEINTVVLMMNPSSLYCHNEDFNVKVYKDGNKNILSTQKRSLLKDLDINRINIEKSLKNCSSFTDIENIITQLSDYNYEQPYETLISQVSENNIKKIKAKINKQINDGLKEHEESNLDCEEMVCDYVFNHTKGDSLTQKSNWVTAINQLKEKAHNPKLEILEKLKKSPHLDKMVFDDTTKNLLELENLGNICLVNVSPFVQTNILSNSLLSRLHSLKIIRNPKIMKNNLKIISDTIKKNKNVNIVVATGELKSHEMNFHYFEVMSKILEIDGAAERLRGFADKVDETILNLTKSGYTRHPRTGDIQDVLVNFNSETYRKSMYNLYKRKQKQS